MKAEIYGNSIGGTVQAPSSKSFAQRYILMAGFSERETEIRGLSFSDDEQVAIDIIKRCGARVEYSGRNIHVIPSFHCPEALYVGESATSYRLAAGLLSSRRCRTEFTGMPGLGARPVEPLLNALSGMRVAASVREDGFISLDASGCEVADVAVDGSLSSQFISSLLLFYAFSGKDSRLSLSGGVVSERYVDITIECLRNFGVDVSGNEGCFSISGGNPLAMGEISVEGDYSSASFFIVLGLLASVKGVTVKGLRKHSLQPDSSILGILSGRTHGIMTEQSDGEISVTSRMSEIERIVVDADSEPDLAPPLSVIGIFSSGGIVIKNCNRLEIKESRRASEIMRLAESFGAEVVKDEDTITIRKGRIINPGRLSFTDHRMIMSAIIAGVASGFRIEYENIEKINKSYPDFLTHLKSAGAEVTFEISR